MMQNNKIKMFILSAVTASFIGTNSCGMTTSEIVQRAAGAAIGASSAYLTSISPQDEIQIGNQMKAQVFSQYKEYTASPSLVNYVRSVGNKVVAIASRKNEINYQFYILNSPEINAFTIPGGSVFITTETLKYIKNEAELAGVLAHEIGHNEKKHTISSIRRAMAAQGVAQGALSQNDPALVQLVASLALNLILNGYSRGQENEADETGTRFITRLGYEPRALSSFLQTLLSYYGKDPSKFVQLFQTHPGSQVRINNLNTLISKEKLIVSKPILNESVYKQYESVLPPKVKQNG